MDDDLKSRIREIQDNVVRDRSGEYAEKARNASSSLGAETPITVLADIRDVNAKLLEATKEMRDVTIENDRNQERRHKEMCTLLMGVSQSSSTRQMTGGTDIPSAATNPKQQYYYGSTTLTSGAHVVACIVMHLDIMLSEHPGLEKMHMSDSTFMDMKDWYIITGYLLNADKTSKAGLRIPKPSDEDFKSVCRLMAASAPGRRPRCEPSHIGTLLSESPGIMNTVEWIRSALTRCKGILSPEREYRFNCIKHPFINSDMDLEVSQNHNARLPSKSLYRSVSEFKGTQKKEYMSLILEGNKKHMDALNTIYASINK